MPADYRDYGPNGMFMWHLGRCAVCGGGPNVVIDHDHVTGLVRGLLCVRCNQEEPRRNTGVFVLYRRINPAFLFGVEIRWSNSSNWAYRQWRSG